MVGTMGHAGGFRCRNTPTKNDSCPQIKKQIHTKKTKNTKKKKKPHKKKKKNKKKIKTKSDFLKE
jgi:hypothetical protein